jgi:D,D-heptose 1,7-bisphosphate phosphatase
MAPDRFAPEIPGAKRQMGKYEVKKRATPHRATVKKRQAVFLDRDGTLIFEYGDIVRPSQVKILKTVPEGLRLMRELGFLLIVITNQPVVGKGLISKSGVKTLNTFLNGKFIKRAAHIDAFYFCPHRAWDDCPCRKPKLGLVRQAVRKYHIDLKRSFFVGDDMRDIETGLQGNMTTILVKTGKAGRDKQFFDVKPDFVARDLLTAARFIARKS